MIGRIGFCLMIGGAIGYWLDVSTWITLGIVVLLLFLLSGVEIGKAPYSTRKRR